MDLAALGNKSAAELGGGGHVATALATGFYLAGAHPDEVVHHSLRGDDVHFVTGGRWSMHELLTVALDQIGPAKMYFSTFAITEFPARVIAKALGDGRVTEVNLLVDYRAKTRYAESFQLIENVATRIRQAPVHAKVMVLEGYSSQLTVVGSANWTVNPRMEAGVASGSITAAAFHKEWLLKAIDNGHPFDA